MGGGGGQARRWKEGLFSLRSHDDHVRKVQRWKFAHLSLSFPACVTKGVSYALEADGKLYPSSRPFCRCWFETGNHRLLLLTSFWARAPPESKEAALGVKRQVLQMDLTAGGEYGKWQPREGVFCLPEKSLTHRSDTCGPRDNEQLVFILQFAQRIDHFGITYGCVCILWPALQSLSLVLESLHTSSRGEHYLRVYPAQLCCSLEHWKCQEGTHRNFDILGCIPCANLFCFLLRNSPGLKWCIGWISLFVFHIQFPLKRQSQALIFFFLVGIFGSEYMLMGSSVQETGITFTWKWSLQSPGVKKPVVLQISMIFHCVDVNSSIGISVEYRLSSFPAPFLPGVS